MRVMSLFITTALASLSFKGADWSSVLVEERAGNTYSTISGAELPFEEILAESGVNAVRQRIWVTDGDYGLDYNLAIAKRAHAAGLSIYLDFHFSPTWADPTHQATPSQWANYDIDNLKWAVYNYTLGTMNSFASAGLSPALVSIGNEITNGLLWPVGNIKNTQNIAAILHSASAGIKDSELGIKPKIVIHLDNGWNYGTQQWWYDTMLAAGDFESSDYDVQGVSYYPFYNSDATLASLSSTLSQMKSRYGKEIMVVETNWPTSCPHPQYAFPSDTSNIPFSAAGQATWIKDVANIVSSVGGTGLYYWEPGYLQEPPLGSSCADNLMVDSNGQALSSLSTFESI